MNIFFVEGTQFKLTIDIHCVMVPGLDANGVRELAYIAIIRRRRRTHASAIKRKTSALNEQVRHLRTDLRQLGRLYSLIRS